jgi:hypothetical protein
LEFHRRVRAGYLELRLPNRRVADHRCRCSIETVRERVCAVLCPKLPPRGDSCITIPQIPGPPMSFGA